jgi:ribosomal protein L24
MKNSLAEKGLSMSQAQSISNLCNQRAKEIASKLSDVNNASKQIVIDKVTYTEQQGIELPANVSELLIEKARLSATQAFLMENIKAKDELINSIKGEYFEFATPAPVRPDYAEANQINSVNEKWGWDQLTVAEYNEFLEAEAFAAHIGQFIHKGGKLDQLRAELPTIKTLEFMEIETGKKTPMTISVHHKADDLMELHEELAGLHRGYEQKVNYFKAKVKNAVTAENARIAKENAIAESNVNVTNEALRLKYSQESETWRSQYGKALQEFEAQRQVRIQTAANLRIEVAPRFQDVVDEFLKAVKE